MTTQSKDNQSNNKSASQSNDGKDPTRVEAGKKAAETRKAHGSDNSSKSDKNR